MEGKKPFIWLEALLIVGMLSVLVNAQPPEVLWTHSYGGSGDDCGLHVQQTSDGGYVVVNENHSVSPQTGFCLIKTDSNGNDLWSYSYDYQGWTIGGICYSVRQTSDGGYILAGSSSNYSSLGNEDVLLVKVNSGGGQEWIQHYGGSNQDNGYGVCQESDGGYTITGRTISYGAGGGDVWLIHTDSQGNMLWNRTFGGTGPDWARGIEMTNDRGYVLAGNTASYGAGSWDFWLIKTDAAGNEIWKRTFGGSLHDQSSWAQQTNDGGYVIAGRTSTYGSGGYDFWLVKTDDQGIKEWDRTFGGSSEEIGEYGQHTDDDGFIVVGYTTSFGAGSADVYVVKTDANGSEEWQATYGGSGEDVGYCIANTIDGGFIISGFEESYGGNDADVWLIRLAGSPWGTISGAVFPPYPNLTVDLMQGGSLLHSTLTNEAGQYSFSDLQPGDYVVDLVDPLGFSVDQNSVAVTLVAGAIETVDFTLTPIVTANEARSKGYWKHQVNANLSGHGSTDYTGDELLGFSQDIFNHFYTNPVNPIQVAGVTYVGSLAAPLTLQDLQYMLNINQGGSTLYQRACQQYLTLFLNVVSNKLGQYAWASTDHATVSQAIVYINQILASNPNQAKNIAEILNEAQMMAAGIIPLTTPTIIFNTGLAQTVGQVYTFSLSDPAPNPFNATTAISYQLSAFSHVTLKSYDLSGRLVTTLVDSWQQAGTHSATFDGSNLASGVYLYRLTMLEPGTIPTISTGKMVLLK